MRASVAVTMDIKYETGNLSFFVDEPETEATTLSNDANGTHANGTGDGEEMWPEPSKYNTKPDAYFVPLLFSVVFVVGLVGNGTLIYTVLRNKKMRNVPNIFIVSLAAGDLLLILVSVPFTATIYTFNYWAYGQFMCKLNEFLQSLSLGVSVFTLTALSGDRYTAIVNPMKKHQSNATMRTMCTAVGIWGFAFVLAIPDAVTSHVTHDEVSWGDLTYCHLYPDSIGDWYIKLHVITHLFAYFLLPVTIIGTFYALMARVLVNSYQHMPGDAMSMKGQAHRQMEARKKVAKVVLSFVVVFIICWLPRHIYVVWYHLLPGDFNLFWFIFKLIGFCLCYINSCVNPLALYFLSRQFRRYYNQYLLCWCTGKGGPSDVEVSQTGTMYNFNSTANKRNSTSVTGMTTNNTVC